ncbi:extracellular cellulase (rare lipoprotein A) [Phlyctema vagabunda]|uniref:Extracellular cellulase (Rare lipoprotein A) n=1 Tax=Phlyctema vagabunda TaxID=108571 RepID=A0ABR4P2Q8_9HELO
MYFSNLVLAFAATLPTALGAALAERATTGTASWYGGNLDGGSCSFTGYTLPSGVFGTALSSAYYSNAANCGACVSVKGPNGKTITAMIVDECPGGCAGYHLDLFPTAFSSLANPDVGVIPITWDFVKCPITSPLQLRNKSGVSQWWFSMQVRNANQAVAKLEVSTNSGKTWLATQRQTYNYFQIASGTGTTVVDVRVTSKDGKVVTVKSVPIKENQVVSATSNFA